MARTGSGTKFVSVNLNNSYGQHASAGSIGGVPALQGQGRSRLSTIQGGMLLLTRPGRSQLSGGKGVKVSAPRPMNLPSLRREHAGNDPTIALVGSSGWSKQQQDQQQPIENGGAHSVSPVNLDAPSARGRSAALTTDSTWGGHSSTTQIGELKPPANQAPVGRPGVYTPPGVRAVQANGSSVPTQVAVVPVGKAVVLRGEDFPTLQASLPPPSAPPQQRQRELQKRQREKQQELKEQQSKLHQLSRQQQANKIGTDNVSSLQQSCPQLQPEQSMRPQMKPKLPPSSIRDEKQSSDSQDSTLEQPRASARKADNLFSGPPPLVRLSHTSHWTDDERETIHSLRPQSMVQSDIPERDRGRSGPRGPGPWVLDRNHELDRRHPSPSRNGSFSGGGRIEEDFMGIFPGKESGYILDGWNGRGNDFGSYESREAFSGRAGNDGREGMDSRDSSFFGEGSFKRGGAKDPYFSRDAGFGGINRSTGLLKYGTINKDTNFDKDNHVRIGGLGRDARTGREAFYGRESPVKEALDGGFGKHGFYARRAAGGDQDVGRRWQGSNRFGKNSSHQLEGSANYWQTNSFLGGRGMQDSAGFDLSRARRPGLLHGQPHKDHSFVRDITDLPSLDTRANSGLGMESFGVSFGLDFKVSRRKKDVTNEDSYRDPERESFEAELERVQKMQEQERQRAIEERERAIQLALKEQEEREQAAREEEERQRRLEQEAQEAALRAEREALEAAQKLEEERKAREEEKRRMLMEEERRKEAARRKLLELEERIAKREAEKKREESRQREEERVYAGRLSVEGEPRYLGGKREHLDWEEGQDDDHSSVEFSQSAYSMPLEAFNEPISGVKYVKRDTPPPEFPASVGGMSERTKTSLIRKRESLHNGHGSAFLPPGEDYALNWQHWHAVRNFSSRDTSHGTQSNGTSMCTEDRGPLDCYPKKDPAPYLREQHWDSIEDIGFSPRYSRPDVDNRYSDSSYDHWVRDNDYHIHEDQNLPLHQLPYYSQEVDSTDPFPQRRLRQSLSKQPRVLPPPSRASLIRTSHSAEDNQSFSSVTTDDEPSAQKVDAESLEHGYIDDAYAETGQQGSEKTHSDGDHVDMLQDGGCFPHKMYLVKQEETIHKTDMQFLSPDIDSQEVGNPVPQMCPGMQDECSSSNSLGDDQEDGSVSFSARNEGVFDSEVALESPAPSKESSMNGEDMDKDWAVDCGVEDLGEVEDEEDFDEIQDESPEQEMENWETEPLKIVVNGDENTSEFLAKDYEEPNMESRNVREIYDEKLEHDGQIEMPLQSQAKDIVEEKQEIAQRVEVSAEEPDNGMHNLQETTQEHVTEPFIQPSSFLSSNALDSIRLGHPDNLCSRQSFVQQFQQPFSFMAVPLPQSDSSSIASPRPSGLASMPGFQNQQEMPFQMQLGLLPGTPLLPNAIQIGSLQMPLHLHPQVPQLAHLHGPQPLFQFGQIGHSAPFSQPLPIVQPGVQIHHPIGHSMPSQPLQSQSAQKVGDSVCPPITIPMQQNTQPAMEEDTPPTQRLGHLWVEHKAATGKSDCMETIEDSSIPMERDELSGQSSPCGKFGSANEQSKFSYEHKDLDQDDTGEAIQEAIPDRTSASFPSDITVVERAYGDVSMARSNGMPHSGRRRGGTRGFGFYGRGRGRMHTGMSETTLLPEAGAEGGFVHNRFFHRNLRKTEFKVKDSGQLLDRNLSDYTVAGKRQLVQSFESDAFSNSESVVRTGQMVSIAQVNRTVSGNARQCAGSAVVTPALQIGSRSDRSAITKAPQKNVPRMRSSEGILKKYVNPEVSAAAPLQSGVVCVFEQPGIETPNDDDDFIEVRSKRQMLNDRREQREKENKAKSKDSKVKEQAARKQRFPAKAGQQSEGVAVMSAKLAGSQLVERYFPILKPSTEAVNNGTDLAQSGYDSGMGPMVPQTPASIPAQPLAPIGTPASSLPDMTTEKRDKGLKSVPSNCALGVTCNDFEEVKSVIEGPGVVLNSNSGSTGAWGSQHSTHHVVSLTQIQLEEAMRPAFFGSSLSQQLPLPSLERVVMALEPGIPVSSAIANEKVSAAVSGPISSLLAGEKIQFGAVTSPTLILPNSQPLSPAIMVGAGSSLASIPDDSLDPNNQEQDFSGRDAPDRDGGIASQNNQAKGDDASRQEADAEAAASAVAVAAFNSDYSIGSMHLSSARNAPLSVMAGPASFEKSGSTAASSGNSNVKSVVLKGPSIDNSMAASLPADLSVETPSTLLHGSVFSGQCSSGLVMPSVPGGPSAFPFLEMGTMLGSPIFALGPREDAPSISRGSNRHLETGIPSLSMGGWQQQHSGGVDSFYGGPPSGYTGPFIDTAGSIPGIQGPPHMLVYTNPFASVGQFGQLGVSFMGAAYLPSGKQPDWKHTPVSSSLASSGSVEGEMGASLGGILASQHNTAMLNPVQRVLPGCSSVMSAAPPPGLFDLNFSAPFQISNGDVPMQSRWSHITSRPPHNTNISGPLMGLCMHPHHSGTVPGQIGNLSHIMETSCGFHPIPKEAGTGPFSSVDAAAQFPDELGLGDSLSSNASSLSGGQIASSRGHMMTSGTSMPSGGKVMRGRRTLRSAHNNNASGSDNGNASLESNSGVLDGQLSNESCGGLSHFQQQNLYQSGGQVENLMFIDQKVSQQGGGRVTMGNDWSGSYRKGGYSGRLSIPERGSLGERVFPPSSKFKQVYIAKAAALSQKSGSLDCGASIFNSEEASRGTIGH